MHVVRSECFDGVIQRVYLTHHRPLTPMTGEIRNLIYTLRISANKGLDMLEIAGVPLLLS